MKIAFLPLLVPYLLMAAVLFELLEPSLAFESVRKNIVIMRKCIKIRHIVNTFQIALILFFLNH